MDSHELSESGEQEYSSSQDDEPWSVFATPLDKMLEPVDPRKDGRQIRDITEIHVTMPEYDMAHNLDTLQFPAPNTSANAKILCDSLLRLSFETNRLTESLRDGGALLARDKSGLNRVRQLLITLLADRSDSLGQNRTILSQSHRLDVYVFQGILQCMCSLAHDRNGIDLLKNHSCSSVRLQKLLEHRVVPDTLKTRPFSEYRLPDIMSSLKWLETNWLVMPYIDCLSSYLDLLMTRLAVLCIVPQPEHMYGAITDYKRPLDDTWFTCTQRLLEDCCWTFGPMYKKLLLYKRIVSSRSTAMTIPDAEQKKVEKTVVDNALEMNNKDIIGLFLKTYMRCALRPSEKSKYLRDYKSKAVSTPAIIEKMRGEDTKKHIMERLAKASWIIAREKLFDKTTTDILYILLLDSFVSNITGLSWMNTFVDFNVQLIRKEQVQKYLDRDYPCLVQDFNTFNLLYKGVLHVHNSAAKSYLHWLAIMLRPPFNGRFLSRTLTALTEYSSWLPQIDALH